MKFVTHDGPFHADDVFGAALLKELYPKATLIRSRDASVIAKADLVFDVGGIQDKASHRFDHHMPGAKKRYNGITYSAFGLLWEEYGLEYCGMDKGIFQWIEKKLVVSIDADDNGFILDEQNTYRVTRPTIDTLIRSFNPVEDENYNDQFDEAVYVASLILKRLKKTAKKNMLIQEKVLSSYKKSGLKEILCLDFYIPVHDLRDMPKSLKYIICPENESRWLVCAVQDTDAFDSLRHPFPASWAGLSGSDFEDITGVKGVQSCHKNRFIAVASTKDAALHLAKLANV